MNRLGDQNRRRRPFPRQHELTGFISATFANRPALQIRRVDDQSPLAQQLTIGLDDQMQIVGLSRRQNKSDTLVPVVREKIDGAFDGGLKIRIDP